VLDRATDNVGVTGYRVERCETKRSPARLSSQIAIPTVSPFSDTSSLAASTTYRYRVRATDERGTFPLFSTIVVCDHRRLGGGSLAVGTLVHDGPATPEQISLFLPITGRCADGDGRPCATGQTGSATWNTGHPMYRIRPTMTEGAQRRKRSPTRSPGRSSISRPHVLRPRSDGDSGAVTNVQTAHVDHRALPPAAGPVTVNVNAGQSTRQIQTRWIRSPPETCSVATQTYNLSSNLIVNRSGTSEQPHLIRGQSAPGSSFQSGFASSISWTLRTSCSRI